MTPSGEPTSRAAASVISCAAAVYLLVQLSLPLWVIARRELTSRDFAWDMFSYHLSCSKLDAVLFTENGGWQSVRLDHDFGSWAQLRRALSAPRFADYARGVCAHAREASHGPVRLHLLSECRSDRDQPAFALLDPERDFCRAR